VGSVPTDPIIAGGITGITIDGTSAEPGSAASGRPDFLPKFQRTNQLEVLNTLSWLRGDHSFKFGADVMAPDEERVHGRAGGARLAALPQPLHREPHGRLPARLRERRADLERVRGRAAPLATSFFVHDDCA
jgi:hypothetical protein